MLDGDEIEWVGDEPKSTVAMDMIASYFASNGHYQQLSEVSNHLFHYIALNGCRPVDAVEWKFLKMMGVEER